MSTGLVFSVYRQCGLMTISIKVGRVSKSRWLFGVNDSEMTRRLTDTGKNNVEGMSMQRQGMEWLQVDVHMDG